MDENTKKMMNFLGMEQCTIEFENPKEVLIHYSDPKTEDDYRTNVTNINILKYSDHTTIEVAFNTEEGQAVVGSAIQNIESLVVRD